MTLFSTIGEHDPPNIAMSRKGKLKLVADWNQENEIIEGLIRDQCVRREVNSGVDPQPTISRHVSILEAGCGRSWPFHLNDIDCFVTGIDTDPEALKARKYTLDRSIEGDIVSADFEADSFDVVYCSFVLEHIERADLAMKNFCKWIRPNGLIIIRIPDPHSVQGFLTRKTPHWFHLFYYRVIEGIKEAGKPGYGPYPTFYNPIVSRQGIRDYCGVAGNLIKLESEYGDGYVRQGRGPMKPLIHLFKKVVSIVSGGVLNADHTNLLYILRKRSSEKYF